MFKNCCSTRSSLIWTIIVGLLLVGSFLLAFIGIPKIIESQIHAQTCLKNDTDQWDRFVEIPFDLNYTVRFFIVNNTKDIKNGKAPQLVESSPYNYKLKIKKTNLRFDDFNEDSVTYKRIFSFQFDTSGSTSENEEITIVNPLLMASFQLTSAITRLALAGCIDKLLKPAGLNGLFLTKSVKSLLFEGMPFAFKNDTKVGVACGIVRNKLYEMAETIRVLEHVTEGDEYIRLAFFNYKTVNYLKDSPDGTYTVNRGIDDMDMLGTIMRWNGGTEIPTYGTMQSTNNLTCQTLKGTDSTIYRPKLPENEDLIIFNTDLCRTVKLSFVAANETYMDIKANRYETNQNFFKPSTLIKEKDCYCSKATKDLKNEDNCYLDGLFDFKPCIGVPLLVSHPHFLFADSKYQQSVKGLNPVSDLHNNYLLVEPNTGSPLVGLKRIQINSVFRKESLISFITPPTMYEVVFPVLWLEESFRLPQHYVDIINDQYFSKVKLASGLKYGLIAVLASFFAGCLYFCISKHCTSVN
ncbi:hypothetical protein ABEB36_001432 [Hypothenemus hampei]|uniref:Sensory neuron membrane protein 2 n=1 Tax=Hypothenemus hampei TaxID=57062 RepID=A0ABD1FF55_HYPHA